MGIFFEKVIRKNLNIGRQLGVQPQGEPPHTGPFRGSVFTDGVVPLMTINDTRDFEVQALLHVLLLFLLLRGTFTNKDLREHPAPLLGKNQLTHLRPTWSAPPWAHRAHPTNQRSQSTIIHGQIH
jgi:hypothetical protein